MNKEQHEDLLKKKQRQIWANDNLLKQFRKVMGDKQFYNMLDNCEIVTNTTGADYIQNFIEEYESNRKT